MIQDFSKSKDVLLKEAIEKIKTSKQHENFIDLVIPYHRHVEEVNDMFGADHIVYLESDVIFLLKEIWNEGVKHGQTLKQ